MIIYLHVSTQPVDRQSMIVGLLPRVSHSLRLKHINLATQRYDNHNHSDLKPADVERLSSGPVNSTKLHDLKWLQVETLGEKDGDRFIFN